MSTVGKRDGDRRFIQQSRLRALLGEEGFIQGFSSIPPASQTATSTKQVDMLQDRFTSPLSLCPLQVFNSSGHAVILQRKTIPAHVLTDG